MQCDTARELMEDMLDGRLDPARETGLREHCASCPPCASALGAADAFAAQVSASFRASREAAPADVPRRVMRTVAREAAPDGAGGRITHVRGLLWLGAAAAAVAAAAVALFLQMGGPAEDEAATIAGRAGEERRVPDEPNESNETRVEVAVLASGKIGLTRAEATQVAGPAPGAPLAAGDTIRATGAEPAEVALADGTRVFLDAGSEAVIAPAGSGARTIRLVSGSLFAEVEKGAEPFVVATAFGEVTTLGTRFGVALGGGEGSDQELAVSVEEGAVRVEHEGGREVVEAGSGHVFRRGHGHAHSSGDECRERFRWMEHHRERCRLRCESGECNAFCRHSRGGHGPGDHGRGPEGAGPGREAGAPRRGPGGQHAGEPRREERGPGEGERHRIEERTRTEAQRRAEERKRAEERRRVEEQRRAEENERSEDRRRIEEQERAEEERRAEEENRAEEERRRSDDEGRRGGGGPRRGGGGGGGGRGGRGRR